MSVEETIAGINHDTVNAANSLTPILDKVQIENAFAVTGELIKQGGTFISNRSQEAQALKDQAARGTDEQGNALSEAQIQELKAQAKSIEDVWGPGGMGRMIMTALSVGAGANVTGSVSNLASGAAIAYVQQLGAAQIKELIAHVGPDNDPETEALRALLHGALACAGAAASGQSCGAGAAGAAGSSLLNSAISAVSEKDSADLTNAEKESRSNLISSIAGAVAAATGEALDAATAAGAAKMETENNSVVLKRGMLKPFEDLNLYKKDPKALGKRLDDYIKHFDDEKLSVADSTAGDWKNKARALEAGYAAEVFAAISKDPNQTPENREKAAQLYNMQMLELFSTHPSVAEVTLKNVAKIDQAQALMGQLLGGEFKGREQEALAQLKALNVFITDVPVVGQPPVSGASFAVGKQAMDYVRAGYNDNFFAAATFIAALDPFAFGQGMSENFNVQGGVKAPIGPMGKVSVVESSANAQYGRLIGSMEKLSAAEKNYVNELLAGGRNVEIIPTGIARTADFIIDGTRYELKTVSNIINQTSDGISKSLSSTIMSARGQSGNIIIDARGQAGMTADIAIRAANRAFGADAKNDVKKIQSLTIITPEGTVHVPRLPR